MLKPQFLFCYDAPAAAMPAAPSDGVRKALERLVHDVRDLADNSHGVIGLHKNGDDAPWSELTEGGRYDDWLGLALEQADAALSQTMQPQAGAVYVDSAPHLHIGDSAFEDWYQNYLPNSVGHKQIARDAYAAGMGDPLVVVAPAAGEQVGAVARSLAEWRRLYDSKPENILRGHHFTEFVEVGNYFDGLAAPGAAIAHVPTTKDIQA